MTAFREDREGGNDLVEDLRLRAEALLDDADKVATAWLEEAEANREDALSLRERAQADLVAGRTLVERERDALMEEARQTVRREAELLIQEAQREAAAVLATAREEGWANARVEAENFLQEAQRTATSIIERATIEADRLVAEAHREESRVLLEARARVDEVRSRLIRLYQEMEGAAAARWGHAPGRTSRNALEDGGRSESRVELP